MASVSGGAAAPPTFRGLGAARTTAIGVAGVFLLVGVLGFIPGVTTGYETMTFAGHDSGAMLFGVFNVSVLHNLVHLLFGVVGAAMAMTTALARAYLIGGGIIYLVLWIYGLVINEASAANFIPLNDADDWLHLALGAVMVLLGALLKQRVVGGVRSAR